MAWSALFITSHTCTGSADRLFIGAVSHEPSRVRRAADYRPPEPITFLRKTHILSQASAATNEPTEHSDRACCLFSIRLRVARSSAPSAVLLGTSPVVRLLR